MNDQGLKKLELIASALQFHLRDSKKLGLKNLELLIGAAELEVRDTINAIALENEDYDNDNACVIAFPGR